MSTVVICQSNYIPWKGYFDLIGNADVFVIYDDAQFTKNDWRNRNKIKTPQGSQWLTIPVKTAGQLGEPIKNIQIQSSNWQKKHLKSFEYNYSKTPFFEEIFNWISNLYGFQSKFLTDINYHFISEICKKLGIETKIVFSMDYKIEGDNPTQKLVGLLKQLGAKKYLSGPSAQTYLDSGLFESEKLELDFFSYNHYQEYSQPHPPFDHYVTILDLLLSKGKDARVFMKSFQ